MSKYFKSVVYMRPEIYESWCEINKNKPFLFDTNPYVYYLNDDDDVSLISNPVTGIKHINLLLVQASLFKSITLVNFIKRFIFFNPSAKVIIYFDKKIKNNLLLLKKLDDLGCRFMLKADDWEDFDHLDFSEIEQINEVNHLMKKKKSRKRLYNDFNTY